MVDIEQLESFDRFAGMRNALKKIAADREHWAGIPMPLQDLPLQVHPSYPMAEELMAIKADEPEVDTDGIKIRNQFWSTKYRCAVCVVEYDGKITYCVRPGGANQVTQLINTLGASDAWGIEQEHRALELLGSLIRHHHFKQYLLTGTFMESSERSKVTYLFRKLRPTIALKEWKGKMRILAALCGHPIAYYQGSWGGAMTPSDDVVSHLMMMRADEHLFWKRCNQHHPSRPEAGI